LPHPFPTRRSSDLFRSQPEAYLHRPVPLAMPVATAQITRNKPAAAPPLRVSEPAALQVESKVEYTCPMHPEVRETVRQPKQAPGSCPDRKSTRLNSSHGSISYAVFCLKKKKKYKQR